MKEHLYIVKIGGQIIDDDARLKDFLEQFARLEGRKILVHGGGKLATRLAEQLGIPQTLVEGRRITDAETLRVVVMVYAGWINKQLVAFLQALKSPAIGFSGADGNLLQARKRTVEGLDYGYAGDLVQVNTDLLLPLFASGICPVVSPITHDGQGQLLNTNADTIAQALAVSCSEHSQVTLIYSFEKPGVLLDVDDPNSLIPKIDRRYFDQLKATRQIFAGMIPKLENAFQALDAGVNKVIIGPAENLSDLVSGQRGTSIVHQTSTYS